MSAKPWDLRAAEALMQAGRIAVYGALGYSLCCMGREDAPKPPNPRIIAQRDTIRVLDTVVHHDTIRLRTQRGVNDTRIGHNTYTTPMPDSTGREVFVPVVPLDTVTAVLKDERAACDSAVTHLSALVAHYRQLDSLRSQSVAVEPMGVRRVAVYAQPMWEPLTQTPVMEGGATVRLFRRVHLVASAEQRFAIGESPRLRLGMRAEW